MSGKPNPPAEIVVCMGSSCFPRGNNRTVELLMARLREEGLQDSTRVTGTLCQNRCKQGPNVTIDGECFCGMDPLALEHLLDQRLGRKDNGTA